MTLTSPVTDRVVVLVERIQAGIDYEPSCREIYHLFRRRIFSFFAARGFSSDECADLTQETFIRVFLGIGGLHSAPRFATWLFEIAANIYRNELRRRGAGGSRACASSSICSLPRCAAVCTCACIRTSSTARSQP